MRYDVEWISDLPIDEFGDSDFERATYKVKTCPTIAKARQVAQGAASADPMGCATIRTSEPITERQARNAGDDDLIWCERGQWYREVSRDEVLA